jgi:hypothetical protein
MNFAHPLALLLLLLLAPIVLLYWLRVRPASRIVGTGLFWQKALAEEHARWRWQRWRPKVSLAIEMLIVVLVALAAAGPQIPASKRIVLVIDNSASMRASDVQPTRLDAAKEAARYLIENLCSCDEMAVVAVGQQPTEVQPLTGDHVLLMSAIDSVQETGEPPAIEEAVKAAREILATGGEQLMPGPRARIVLITDACCSDAAKRIQDNGAELLRVGTAAGNLAITAFTARRSMAEPTKCAVFVEVQNRGEQTKGRVALNVNGKPDPSASFSIAKNGLWQHVFTLDLSAAVRLKAKIEPSDAYPFDDEATLDVPAAPEKHRVKLVCDERSCLQEILKANRRVELIDDQTEVGAAPEVSGTLRVPSGESGTRSVPDTVLIIEGKTPEKLPAGPVLIFSPGACDLWEVGEAIADPLLTVADVSSPITAGVRFFDAYLPEARQLRLVESPGATEKPILWAGAAPLGYAIERPQGRVVVIAGNLATSNMALQAAFPQLIAQALDWLDRQPPWTNEVVGRYSASGPDTMIDLRVPRDIGSNASALVLPKPWPPLWIVPAALAAVLLIIEWCLYQRRWTS